MTVHPRATLTPIRRRQLVDLVLGGSSRRAAAAALRVSPATAQKWIRRFEQASPSERISGAWALDRSCRPRCSPRMLSEADHDRVCEARERTGWGPRLIAAELGLCHSTVHRALRRRGMSRRPRPSKGEIVRYEWPCPGQLLHMDTKKLGRFDAPGHRVTGDRTKRSRHAGWEFVHTLQDDCSRLAYSEIHDDERATTVVAFTQRALDWFLHHGIIAERILTDNAWAYTHSTNLAHLLNARAIEHWTIQPYRPQTNGKVERFNQTLAREWAYGQRYASSTARRQALPHWTHHYNTRRPHSSIGDRPPINRVHDLLGQNS